MNKCVYVYTHISQLKHRRKICYWTASFILFVTEVFSM